MPSSKASETRKKTRSKAGGRSTSAAKKRAPKKRPSVLWRVARFCALIGLLLFILGVAGVWLVFWYYSQDLPQVFSAEDYHPKQVTRIYDRNGKLLAELFDEKRTVVATDAIPQTMRYAIIAAEDAQFYEHKGLDYIGVLRAAYTNIQRGTFSHGASTLTQQVVKNLLLTPEKEVKRKVQEVLLARQLEETLSKDEILTIYLNHVYFGHRVYGIEEASRFYFDKHVGELDLNEAATLAGLVQSPERLSPIKHLDAATDRRNYVLGQMLDKGFINEAAFVETKAKAISIRRRDPPSLGAAPHFVEQVRKMLIAEYGEGYLYTAGLEVYTTLDVDLQAQADEALRAGLRAYDERHGLYRPLGDKESASKGVEKLVAEQRYVATVERVSADELVARVGDFVAPVELKPRSRVIIDGAPLDSRFKVGDRIAVRVAQTGEAGKLERWRFDPGPDGALACLDQRSREVLALAGGYDFAQSSFDRALQAKRQTGSSFKPLVYGAALEAKLISAATVIDDAPKVFHIPGRDKPWSPRNFDNKFKGPMSVRKALAESRNTIAVDVLERVGIEPAREFAARVGVTSTLVDNFTLALGSSEMTTMEIANTFATFASGGLFAEPVFVLRIEGGGGELLFSHTPASKRVISAELAYVMTSLLRSVVTEGTAKAALAKWEHPAAGKTGTSNGPKDTWFVGYTAYLTAAVYVGHDEPRELGKKEGGGKTALPIWADFMRAAHAGRQVKAFAEPPGLVHARIVPESGLLAPADAAKTLDEVFLPGTAPTQQASGEGLGSSDWALKQYEESNENPAEPPTEEIVGNPDGSASGDEF